MKWVKFYEDVMGFKMIITFDDNNLSLEYSALMSIKWFPAEARLCRNFQSMSPAAGKKEIANEPGKTGLGLSYRTRCTAHRRIITQES